VVLAMIFAKNLKMTVMKAAGNDGLKLRDFRSKSPVLSMFYWKIDLQQPKFQIIHTNYKFLPKKSSNFTEKLDQTKKYQQNSLTASNLVEKLSQLRLLYPKSAVKHTKHPKDYINQAETPKFPSTPPISLNFHPKSS
jgi:hypothetical protein